MSQHDQHQEHHPIIELEPVLEPTWAKFFAPIVAFAVLAYLYCQYTQLVA